MDDDTVAWLGTHEGQSWSMWTHTAVRMYRTSRPGVFADVIDDHRQGCPCEEKGITGKGWTGAYRHPSDSEAGYLRNLQTLIYEPSDYLSRLSSPA